MKKMIFGSLLLLSASAFANSVSISTGMTNDYPTLTSYFARECQEKADDAQAQILGTRFQSDVTVSADPVDLSVNVGDFTLYSEKCDLLIETSHGTLSVQSASFDRYLGCNDDLVQKTENTVLRNAYLDETQCTVDTVSLNP